MTSEKRSAWGLGWFRCPSSNPGNAIVVYMHRKCTPDAVRQQSLAVLTHKSEPCSISGILDEVGSNLLRLITTFSTSKVDKPLFFFTKRRQPEYTSCNIPGGSLARALSSRGFGSSDRAAEGPSDRAAEGPSDRAADAAAEPPGLATTFGGGRFVSDRVKNRSETVSDLAQTRSGNMLSISKHETENQVLAPRRPASPLSEDIVRRTPPRVLVLGQLDAPVLRIRVFGGTLMCT